MLAGLPRVSARDVLEASATPRASSCPLFFLLGFRLLVKLFCCFVPVEEARSHKAPFYSESSCCGQTVFL